MGSLNQLKKDTRKNSTIGLRSMLCAAKEVLIKSVAQVIPQHAMSLFKFSVSLCEDLMRMTRKFWWDDEDDKKNIHWSSWDKLTQRKSKGEWASDILIASIKPCWLSERGGFLTN
jgi:hypothetical protein